MLNRRLIALQAIWLSIVLTPVKPIWAAPNISGVSCKAVFETREGSAVAPHALALQQQTLFHLNDSLALPGQQSFSITARSENNLLHYRSDLAPFSDRELVLLQMIETLPLTVSTRRTTQDMDKVSASDGVMPVAELVKRKIIAKAKYYSPSEEDLFGSSQWNFATISASGWTGLPQYGDKVAIIKDSYWEENSWATSTSGLKIYEGFRGIRRGAQSRARIPEELLAGVQAKFKSKVVAPRDYGRWIALDVMKYVRTLDPSEQQEFFDSDRLALVSLLNRYKIGYLEAKLPGIPLSDLTLEKGLTTPGSFTTSSSLNAPSLQPGEFVEVASGQRIKIAERLSEKPWGSIFKAEDSQANPLVLKIYSHAGSSDLKMRAETMQRLTEAASVGFKIPKVHATGANFIIQERVKGMPVGDWVAAWQKHGFQRNVTAFLRLVDLIQRSSRKGIYVSGLGSRSVVWSKLNWVILDAGVIYHLEPREALNRYINDISHEWAKDVGPEAQRQLVDAMSSAIDLGSQESPHAEFKESDHLLSSAVPVELTRTFDHLGWGDQIPADVYLTYDSATIGRAIVEWVAKHEQTALITDKRTEVDLMKNAQIFLHFHSAHLESILEKGFLNQHQTGRSSAINNSAKRMAAEDGFVGLKMSDTNEAALEVRPKSALLHISTDDNLGHYPNPVYPGYGDVTAVLKEEVKLRSLWSAGDSLINGRHRNAENILVSRRGTFQRGYFPSKPGELYTEALVYGKITIDDVDHFLVHDAEQAERLSKLGKPIFLVDIYRRADRTQRRYIRLLWSGGGFKPKQVPPDQWPRFEKDFENLPASPSPNQESRDDILNKFALPRN